MKSNSSFCFSVSMGFPGWWTGDWSATVQIRNILDVPVMFCKSELPRPSGGQAEASKIERQDRHERALGERPAPAGGRTSRQSASASGASRELSWERTGVTTAMPSAPGAEVARM